MSAVRDTGGSPPRRCVACASTELYHEWSVVSAFFARRALHSVPQVTDFFGCNNCGTRYFGLPLSAEQLARQYANYRSEEYFLQRQAYESAYTRAINDGLGSEDEMDRRRQALLAVLASAGVPNQFSAVLDHGGDRGQMLKPLHAARKATYEISGVQPDAGVESVTAEGMRAGSWDLVLCCHVLEHLISPASHARQLLDLGHQQTVFFFEVPNEAVARTALNATSAQRRWLEFLCRHPRCLKFLDYVSTGCLYRLGRVLPFLFLPLREHLTLFSVAGMRQLLEKSGYTVISASLLGTGHIGVLARRPLPGENNDS